LTATDAERWNAAVILINVFQLATGVVNSSGGGYLKPQRGGGIKFKHSNLQPVIKKKQTRHDPTYPAHPQKNKGEKISGWFKVLLFLMTPGGDTERGGALKKKKQCKRKKALRIMRV